MGYGILLVPSFLCLARAQTTTISTPTTLLGGSVNAYVDLVISATTVTLGSGGPVTITCRNFNLMAGGTIMGTSAGSAQSTGLGWSPGLTNFDYQSKGGSHGGCAAEVPNGQNWACPQRGLSMSYGSITAPTALGTGGSPVRSGCASGAGGGALILNITGSATIAGVISMNGGTGNNGNGGAWEAGSGGSGGSIYIIIGGVLSAASTGTLQANGGNGGVTGSGAYQHVSGAGGGGGRIAIYCGSTTLSADQVLGRATGGLAVQAFGGLWGSNTYHPPGGPGSIYASCGAATNTLLFRSNPLVTATASTANPAYIMLSNYGACFDSLIDDTPRGVQVQSDAVHVPTILVARSVHGILTGGNVTATPGFGATLALNATAAVCGVPGGDANSTSWIPASAMAAAISNNNSAAPTAWTYSCMFASSGNAFVASCPQGSTITQVYSACFKCAASLNCPSPARTQSMSAILGSFGSISSCNNAMPSAYFGSCVGQQSCSAYWTGGDTCVGNAKAFEVVLNCSATSAGVITQRNRNVANFLPAPSPSISATKTVSTSASPSPLPPQATLAWNATGSYQSVSLYGPASARIYLWGAGGGGGGDGGKGGAGAFVYGTFDVAMGATASLRIIVGTGGVYNTPPAQAPAPRDEAGGGGSGCFNYTCGGSKGGGSGGGRSSIQIWNVSVGAWAVVATAGGGGGGGGFATSGGSANYTGNASSAYGGNSATAGGTGASPTRVGSYRATCASIRYPSGSIGGFVSDNSCGEGHSGGGGGHYAGGGGINSGAGGGSSYSGGLYNAGGAFSADQFSSPGGTFYPGGGVASGGASQSSGGPGYIVMQVNAAALVVPSSTPSPSVSPSACPPNKGLDFKCTTGAGGQCACASGCDACGSFITTTGVCNCAGYAPLVVSRCPGAGSCGSISCCRSVADYVSSSRSSTSSLTSSVSASTSSSLSPSASTTFSSSGSAAASSTTTPSTSLFATASVSSSPTLSTTPSPTPTPTASWTPSSSCTLSTTASLSASLSVSLSDSVSATPSQTPTVSASTSESSTRSSSPRPSPSASASATSLSSASVSASISSSPAPSATATSTASASPSSSLTISPSQSLFRSESVTASATPAVTPSPSPAVFSLSASIAAPSLAFEVPAGFDVVLGDALPPVPLSVLPLALTLPLAGGSSNVLLKADVKFWGVAIAVSFASIGPNGRPAPLDANSSAAGSSVVLVDATVPLVRVASAEVASDGSSIALRLPASPLSDGTLQLLGLLNENNADATQLRAYTLTIALVAIPAVAFAGSSAVAASPEALLAATASATEMVAIVSGYGLHTVANAFAVGLAAPVSAPTFSLLHVSSLSWPLFRDIIGSAGDATVRSAWLASSSAGDGLQALLGPTNASSDTERVALFAAAAQQSTASATAPCGSFASAPSTLQLSFHGSDVITLIGGVSGVTGSSASSVFTPNTTFLLGGLPCSVLWLAPDGSMVTLLSPPISSMCLQQQVQMALKAVGGSGVAAPPSLTTDSSAEAVAGLCGYASLSITRRPGGETIDLPGLIALSSTPPPPTLAPQRYFSPALTTLSCPPACPPAPLSASCAPTMAAVVVSSGDNYTGGVNIQGWRSPGAGATWFTAPTISAGSSLLSSSSSVNGLVYYSPACVGDFTDASSGSCTNSSDPASAKCAFIPLSSGVCTTCPPNALCPGGVRVRPRPGFYVANEYAGAADSSNIVACPPPAAQRCVGWDAVKGRTLCGAPYRQGSSACSICASGYYRDATSGDCSSCPPSTTLFQRVRPALSIVGALLGIFGVTFLAVLAVQARFGGTLFGGLRRAGLFVVAVANVLMLIAQQGRSASPALPPIMLSFYNALGVLLFEGFTLPPECTSGSPVAAQLTQAKLGCGLAVICFTLIGLQWAWRKPWLAIAPPLALVAQTAPESPAVRQGHGVGDLQEDEGAELEEGGENLSHIDPPEVSSSLDKARSGVSASGPFTINPLRRSPSSAATAEMGTTIINAGSGAATTSIVMNLSMKAHPDQDKGALGKSASTAKSPPAAPARDAGVADSPSVEVSPSRLSWLTCGFLIGVASMGRYLNANFLAGSSLSLILSLYTIVYPTLANGAMKLLVCDPSVTAVSSYLAYDGDGTALVNAGLNASAVFGANARLLAGELLSTSEKSLLSVSVPLRVLRAFPFAVCGEGTQRSGQPVALASLALFSVALPLVTFVFLLSILRARVRQHETTGPSAPMHFPAVPTPQMKLIENGRKSGAFQAPSHRSGRCFDCLDPRLDYDTAFTAEPSLSFFLNSGSFRPTRFFGVHIDWISLLVLSATSYAKPTTQNGILGVFFASIAAPLAALLLHATATPMVVGMRWISHMRIATVVVFVVASILGVLQALNEAAQSSSTTPPVPSSVIGGFALFAFACMMALFLVLIFVFGYSLIEGAMKQERRIALQKLVSKKRLEERAREKKMREEAAAAAAAALATAASEKAAAEAAASAKVTFLLASCDDSVAILETAREMERKDDFEGALALAQRALAVQLQASGDEDPRSIEAMKVLARLQRETGQHEEAASTSAQVAYHYKCTVGRRATETLAAVMDQAHALFALQRFDKALKFFKESLSGYREVYGDEHPITIACMRETAVAHFSLGHYEAAAELDGIATAALAAAAAAAAGSVAAAQADAKDDTLANTGSDSATVESRASAKYAHRIRSLSRRVRPAERVSIQEFPPTVEDDL